MTGYYDRDGIQITLEEWGRLFQDFEYKSVAKTTVVDKTNSARSYEVSTVWLGMDHGFHAPAPVIYETMIFGPEDYGDLEMQRYSTQAQAVAGHVEMVSLAASWCTDPEVTDDATLERPPTDWSATLARVRRDIEQFTGRRSKTPESDVLAAIAELEATEDEPWFYRYERAAANGAEMIVSSPSWDEMVAARLVPASGVFVDAAETRYELSNRGSLSGGQ